MPSYPPHTVVRVADYFQRCSTRGRARSFYPVLLERLDSAASDDRIIVSFAGVEYVSPSFLDELLAHLAADRPEIVRRLFIHALTPSAVRRLQMILEHRELAWAFQPLEATGIALPA